MRRDPSLHIARSDLITVMATLMPKAGPTDVEAVVSTLFDLAQPYQIKDRYLQLAGAKDSVKKKARKSVEADAELPFGALEKFNRILTAVLSKDNTFRKIQQITKDSKDYILLKEIAVLAYKFVQAYDIIPIEDGFKEYVALGLKLMPKYALNKFKFYDRRIAEAYECYIDLVNDRDADATGLFYDIYTSFLLDKAGLVDTSEKDYTKYAHFLYGRQAADKAKADYTVWVKAQFDGLNFMGVVPEINQLYGENALKRYERALKVVEPDGDKELDLTQVYTE